MLAPSTLEVPGDSSVQLRFQEFSLKRLNALVPSPGTAEEGD